MAGRERAGGRSAALAVLAFVATLAAMVSGCRTTSEGPVPGPSSERPEVGVDARPVAEAGGGPGPDVAAAPDGGGGVVLPDALGPDPAFIGHWKLDEQGALVAADSSGKNNPASLVDLTATAWTMGRIDGAIEIPYGRAHLRVASSVSLNGIFRAVTVTAWVFRPSNASPPPGGATVLSRQGAYALGFDGEYPRWAITVDARPMPAVLKSLETAARGRWIHMAGTFDGTQSRLYIDGREVAAVAFAGTVGSSMVPLTLGARLATTIADEALGGRLDDVRLYARALAASEIAALSAP